MADNPSKILNTIDDYALVLSLVKAYSLGKKDGTITDSTTFEDFKNLIVADPLKYDYSSTPKAEEIANAYQNAGVLTGMASMDSLKLLSSDTEILQTEYDNFKTTQTKVANDAKETSDKSFDDYRKARNEYRTAKGKIFGGWLGKIAMVALLATTVIGLGALVTSVAGGFAGLLAVEHIGFTAVSAVIAYGGYVILKKPIKKAWGKLDSTIEKNQKIKDGDEKTAGSKKAYRKAKNEYETCIDKTNEQNAKLMHGKKYNGLIEELESGALHQNFTDPEPMVEDQIDEDEFSNEDQTQAWQDQTQTKGSQTKVEDEKQQNSHSARPISRYNVPISSRKGNNPNAYSKPIKNNSQGSTDEHTL